MITLIRANPVVAINRLNGTQTTGTLYTFDLTDAHFNYATMMYQDLHQKADDLARNRQGYMTLKVVIRPTTLNPNTAQLHVNVYSKIPITDQDVIDLFAGVELEETVKVQLGDDPYRGVMIDDKDYWWKQKGLCPICKDNTKPICQPGGIFVCPKCGWNNNTGVPKNVPKRK